DPIPSADGALQRRPTVLLADAPAGHEGAVVRISDRDPEVLRDIAARGLGLGSEVGAGDLPAGAAGAVWVTAL
nr:ferrous iron transport protein A [Actinomycetota bacterium]